MAFLRKFHLEDPWGYRFFPFELGYFLFGALAYRYRAKMDWIIPKKFGMPILYALVILLVMFRLPLHLPTLTYPLTLALLLPAMFRTSATNKTDRMVGELSYPFYIYHLFALTMAEELQRRVSARLDVAWVGLALTLLLSVATLALETRYVEPWRARLSKGKSPAKVRTIEIPAIPVPAPVAAFAETPVTAFSEGPMAIFAESSTAALVDKPMASGAIME